jgi:hypothetical protein
MAFHDRVSVLQQRTSKTLEMYPDDDSHCLVSLPVSSAVSKLGRHACTAALR